MGTTSIGGREESGYDWKRCPPERFSYFPISYSNRDPEKGKINRQSSSSSILLLVYCSWFKTDMYTEEGSTTRGGGDGYHFHLQTSPFFYFSIFFFRFSATAGKTNQNETQHWETKRKVSRFLFCRQVLSNQLAQRRIRW